MEVPEYLSQMSMGWVNKRKKPGLGESYMSENETNLWPTETVPVRVFLISEQPKAFPKLMLPARRLDLVNHVERRTTKVGRNFCKAGRGSLVID